MNTLQDTELLSIRALRKDGKIDEAYALGKEQLNESPDNMDIRKDFAWVCQDQAKLFLKNGRIEEAIGKVNEVRSLRLPPNDIINKQVFWTLRNILKLYCTPDTDIESRKGMAYRLLEISDSIPFNGPDAGYSSYIHELHKVFKNEPEEYIRLFSKIGFNFYCNEDYEEFVAEGDNKKKSSRAEMIYTSFAKNLLKLIKSDEDNSEWTKTAELFLPLMRDLYESHPSFVTVMHLIAKILLALNRKEEAREMILSNLRNHNDIRLWYIIAESYLDESLAVAMSCLCMGLTLNATDEAKLPLMEKLSLILATKGLYEEARTEIENIDRIKNKKHGKLPDTSPAINALKEENWYTEIKPKKENKMFYFRNLHIAEEMLFSIDKISVVITYVNPDRKFLNFITEEDKKGFFNYSSLLRKDPQQGEIYDIVFEKYHENEPCRIKWIRFNQNPPDSCRLFKFSEGRIRIDKKNDYGFVDNIYVPSDIVAKYNLVNGDIISLKSVRTFDNMKKDLSWRAVSVKRF